MTFVSPLWKAGEWRTRSGKNPESGYFSFCKASAILAISFRVVCSYVTRGVWAQLINQFRCHLPRLLDVSLVREGSGRKLKLKCFMICAVTTLIISNFMTHHATLIYN